MVKKIEIEVTGDTKGLEKALSKAQKSSSSFEKGLSAAAKGGAVALAGLGVAAVYSVNAASNLSEQINKTSVVFRGSEKVIQKWSEGTAESLGISQRAALEAAGTFGNMLVPMGLARDKAGQMSTKMVELAADMASFNNANPEDVLEALRSGLSGETEPLRKFGVFLNQARIEEEALRMGLMKQGGELSSAAKAQATYSIILKDTTDAQGDFARTSDSLANQQRILRAELEDTAAQLGNALIPAATGAASVLLELVNWTKENESAAKALAVGIAALSAGLILANASLKIYSSTALIATGATQGLRAAMAATPWGLAAVAVSGLVAFLVSQASSSDDATESQKRLTDAVRDYHDAIKDGNNARKEYADVSRRVEGAEIAVKRAIEARTQVDKDATSTSLDRREADLRVAGAMDELRDAERAAEESGTKLRKSQLEQIGAQGRAKASVEGLAKEFRENLVNAQNIYKKGAGETREVTGRVSEATDRGRRNAANYADALRAMASKMQDSQPKLAETARLAARLADAWGRVVSLPAAREFVARFSVFTTVETTRTIPKQAGGPVTAGHAYLVGEKRPEVFVPNQSGRIVPRVSQVTGGNGGNGSSGPMQIALIAAGPDVIRQLRELERRSRLGGSLA